jgi:hypothetical protein
MASKITGSAVSPAEKREPRHFSISSTIFDVLSLSENCLKAGLLNMWHTGYLGDALDEPARWQRAGV